MNKLIYLNKTYFLLTIYFEDEHVTYSSSWRRCLVQENRDGTIDIINVRKRNLPSLKWKLYTQIEKGGLILLNKISKEFKQ